MIVTFSFYQAAGKARRPGLAKPGTAATYQHRHTLVFPEGNNSKLELEHNYDWMRIAVVGGFNVPRVQWGLARSGVEVSYAGTWGALEQEFPDIGNDLKRNILRNRLVKEVASDTLVFLSDWVSANAFIKNTHFGSEIIYLNQKQLGVVTRYTFAGSGGTAARKYLNQILSVIFTSGRSIVKMHYDKARATYRLRYDDGSAGRRFEEVILVALDLIDLYQYLNKARTQLPAKVSEVRRTLQYKRGVRLDQRSISKLLASPTDLMAQPYSRNIQPKVVDVPDRIVSHEVQENLQMVTLTRQVLGYLATFLDSPSLDSDFIRNTCQTLEAELRLFVRRNELVDRPVSLARLPQRFVRSTDPILRRAAAIIRRWVAGENLNPTGDGQEKESFISLADKLWELFCLVKIVRALSEKGFEVEVDNQNHILLRRRIETLSIFYDKEITQNVPAGNVHYARSVGSLRPDFALTWTQGNITRSGILDAKFTFAKDQWQGRGEEIYEKYGTWLRKPDGSPLDYVYAIVPSPHPGELMPALVLSDGGSFRAPRLDLGIVALQMSDSDENGAKWLYEMIVMATDFEGAGLSLVS